MEDRFSRDPIDIPIVLNHDPTKVIGRMQVYLTHKEFKKVQDFMMMPNCMAMIEEDDTVATQEIVSFSFLPNFYKKKS